MMKRAQYWLLGWLFLSLGLFLAYCPSAISQAATITVEKQISNPQGSQSSFLQTTDPLAGAQYLLQSIVPSKEGLRPNAQKPATYQITTGPQAIRVTITTNQAGIGTYQSAQLPTGYYLLSEQISSTIRSPAAPIIFHLPNQLADGEFSNDFTYLPKSGLSNDHSMTKQHIMPKTGYLPTNIMQSGGNVLPANQIIIAGGIGIMLLLAVSFTCKFIANSRHRS